MQVKVIDSNEHDPIIVNSPSSITVHDNINVNDSLLRLVARDDDCGEKICGFHIINNQKYFNISDTGNFRFENVLKIILKLFCYELLGNAYITFSSLYIYKTIIVYYNYIQD